MVKSPESLSPQAEASPIDRLPLKDVTPLLRLMGELAVLRNDPRRWRLALLAALNQLLPAAASAAFIIRNVAPQTPPIVVSVFDVGLKIESRREAFLHEFNIAPFRDPFSTRALTRLQESPPASPVFTALRRELIDDAEWNASPHVEQYRVPTHLCDSLISLHRASDQGYVNVLYVFKSAEDKTLFTARDKLLLATLHTGLDWMYRAEESSHRLNRATALSPRLRQTLDCLLAGDTERQVAIKMSLSTHTVHDYVKALYTHFGVSSRSELISRWVHTGGQVPPP